MTAQRHVPEGWVAAPIREVCRLVNGRAFKPSEWSRAGLPIIRIQNLNNPGGKFNHYAGEVDPKHLVRSGELLFAWSGTPGTSFGAHIWEGGRAVLNQHIFRVLFPEESVSKMFLRLAINERLDELIHEAHGGAGLAHVTKPVFEATEILLAPLAEQRRIEATIEQLLARVDRARDHLAKVPTILKRFRQSVLAAACSGRLTEDWRASSGNRHEEPGRDQALSIVDGFDDLFDLPSGWRWGKLGEVLQDIEAGKSFTCEERPPRDGEVGVCKVSSVTWGHYDEGESKTCTDPRKVNPGLFVRVGDFLFSRANTIELVGTCVIARQVTRQIMLSDKILRFRFHDVVPEWVLWILRSPHGRDEIEHLATGNQQSMRNIGQERIRQIRVAFPSLAEQREIARRVTALMRIADGIERSVATASGRAERLIQSILAKAFRGELVPTEAELAAKEGREYEPAAVLLERIRKQHEAQSSQPRRHRDPRAAQADRRTKEAAVRRALE